ncbi:MAG: serine hydrolase [Candidatus Omnitrophota bacterium]
MKYALRNIIYVVLVAFLLAGCAREAPVDIRVSARSAIVVSAVSGEVLFKKNPDLKSPPASTAKVMTAIVAIENAPLNKKIIPSRNAVKVEPVVAGLKTGVEYSLNDLLAAILIRSANDAAVAIAEGIAGSEEKFADLMNRKAREIGMENTYFANASGLPTGKRDAQHTTTRDLVRMMRYALRYKIILKLLSKKEYVIYGSGKKRIDLKSNNKLLFRSKEAPWGKTGYTNEARRTFVGIDPSPAPRIVIALLKSNDIWDDLLKLERGGIDIYLERRWGLIYRMVRR